MTVPSRIGKLMLAHTYKSPGLAFLLMKICDPVMIKKLTPTAYNTTWRNRYGRGGGPIHSKYYLYVENRL